MNADDLQLAFDHVAKFEGFPNKFPPHIKCEKRGTTFGPSPVCIDASLATSKELPHVLAVAKALGTGWAAILIALPHGKAVAVGGKIIAVECDNVGII